MALHIASSESGVLPVLSWTNNFLGKLTKLFVSVSVVEELLGLADNVRQICQVYSSVESVDSTPIARRKKIARDAVIEFFISLSTPTYPQINCYIICHIEVLKLEILILLPFDK